MVPHDIPPLTCPRCVQPKHANSEYEHLSRKVPAVKSCFNNNNNNISLQTRGPYHRHKSIKSG